MKTYAALLIFSIAVGGPPRIWAVADNAGTLAGLEGRKLIQLTAEAQNYVLQHLSDADIASAMADWTRQHNETLSADVAILITAQLLGAEFYFMEKQHLPPSTVRAASLATLPIYLNAMTKEPSLRSIAAYLSDRLGIEAFTLRKPNQYGALNTKTNSVQPATVLLDGAPLGPAGPTYRVISGTYEASIEVSGRSLCSVKISIVSLGTTDLAC
jgi:hypothetical protein